MMSVRNSWIDPTVHSCSDSLRSNHVAGLLSDDFSFIAPLLILLKHPPSLSHLPMTCSTLLSSLNP